MSDSPYDVLGVPMTATADEIRAAYRGLVKRHHPDAPSGSPDLFRAVQAAYDIVGDVEKRKKYNAVRALLDDAEQVPASDPWGGSFSPSGVFSFSGLYHSASAAPFSNYTFRSSVVRPLSGQAPSGSAWSTHVIGAGPTQTTMRTQHIISHNAIRAAITNPLAQFHVGNRYQVNGMAGIITSATMTDDPAMGYTQVDLEILVSQP